LAKEYGANPTEGQRRGYHDRRLSVLQKLMAENGNNFETARKNNPHERESYPFEKHYLDERSGELFGEHLSKNGASK
jgi:hypothetical protein